MSGGFLPTSDDVRPTAKVGGEPPGRVWGLASPGHPVDRTASVGVASWPAQFFLQVSANLVHIDFGLLMCWDAVGLINKKYMFHQIQRQIRELLHLMG